MCSSSVREIPLGKPNLELYIRLVAGSPSGLQQPIDDAGEVAEWSKAAVSKTVNPVRGSRVRIPASPHNFLLTNEVFDPQKVTDTFLDATIFSNGFRAEKLVASVRFRRSQSGRRTRQRPKYGSFLPSRSLKLPK